ncbi:MAG: TonB-dependent receptor [Bacteroidales bacterium]|nr:TonB-dependent receptor [Bacteroidales bacterium]
MKKLLTFFLAMVASITMMAQVTTSNLSGRIVDADGPLPGATVIATHIPSGTVYGTTTNSEGRYAIQGMRVGGPYTVEVSFVGYTPAKAERLVLKLGETHRVNFELQSVSVGLDEVVIAGDAEKPIMNSTSTTISTEEIANLPTISRSINDVVKVSPYANGMSLAGGDGRSTNFTVDGANFNNNFGLSSYLPGGGTPISVDAIEEIQVVVAPFDVRQSNFVSGEINAITKSGTNQFHGSAYSYFTNQNLRGNKLVGEDLGEREKESLFTYGATVGGPIVKDKLFFFLNAERTQEPSEVIKYRPEGADVTVLDQIYNKLKNDYGYDPGSYTNYPGGNNNLKLLARIDWNINDNNKLMFRFNKTGNTQWNKPNDNSCDDAFRNRATKRSSASSFPFSNNMYSQRNDVLSFATEWNSRLSSQLSNQLLFTYTDINDQRGSNSDIFPHIDIMSGDEYFQEHGLYAPFTSFGYELFTYNNGVLNKVFNATDNLTYYTGNHKITAGVNWERQNARNSYMRNATGYYRFASAEDFLTGALPLSFCLTVGNNGEEKPRGEVTYNQFGLYAQDDWNITENFKLNFGVRADGMFFDESQLMTNNAILNYQMGEHVVNTGKWPGNHIQVSPRVGFTWDATESLTVRGGSGLFQGRLPLVFFTNMPQNSGMIQSSFYSNTGTPLADSVNGGYYVNYSPEVLANLQKLMKPDGTYITNVDEMIAALGLNTTVTPEDGTLPGTINGVDPEFRMPQIWKTMLGVDWTVPVSFPMTITAEGMFNKTLYGVRLVDWNLNYDMIANAGDDVRFNGPDNRVNYALLSDYTYGRSSAYVLTNSREGYGYIFNLAVNASPVKNLDLRAAYTHTESKEISGMPGSDAKSAYSGLYTIDGPTFAPLQRSQYVIPDKVTASVGYVIPAYLFPRFFNGEGVRINLFYTAFSAGGYSYFYSNDLNGDGMATDLMYIPNDVNEIRFATEADKEAFKTFMENDPYLSTHKGQYAEANAGRGPWVHLLDARIAKAFKKKIGNTTHSIELSASFDNILNMFNSAWGLYKYGCYGEFASWACTPLAVDHIENNTPVFSMNKVEGEYPTHTYTRNDLKDSAQCWSVLLGVKYSF